MGYIIRSIIVAIIGLIITLAVIMWICSSFDD